MKEIKENSSVLVAKYDQTNEIINEPAFAWCAPYVLKKRNQIIAKLKSRSKKKTHKFEIRIPNSVGEAYTIDAENNNNYWIDTIRREMNNNRVAFDILDKDQNVEPGRIFLECYMIFEVKMDFRRKARYVANGAKNPNLKISSYSGVVSRETVRITLTYAALNELNVMSADIQDALLMKC